jgi:two-component system response regulator HydG
VVPLVHPGDQDPGLRVALLHDVFKRRVAAEMLRIQEPSIPRQELGPLLEAAREVYHPSSLLGSSEAIRAVRLQVASSSQSPGPILIVGEPGTGRRRIARSLHYGGCSTGPFLQLGCRGIAREHIEAELFGHVKGAGGVADRPGLLHQAQDGTVYLEDVGALPREIQARLSAFLAEGTVTRVGGGRAERVDVRIIASDVPEPASEEVGLSGELRARLGATTIRVPSLAERSDDIECLARHFVERHGVARGVAGLEPEALTVLCEHAWPGNVAELEDTIKLACSRAHGSLLRVGDLPRAVHPRGAADDVIPRRPPSDGDVRGTHSVALPQREIAPVPGRSSRPAQPWDIADDDPISLEHYEKKALMRALAAVKGDKLAAARLLKVGKSTLYRKLKRFDIH